MSKVLGSGQYSKRVYEKAVRLGASVRTSRGKAVRPRKMYRDNFMKWVTDPKAVYIEQKVLLDPRKFIPFRGKSYRTIVAALLTKLNIEKKVLRGKLSQDMERILGWSGMTKSKEINALAGTPWLWNTDLLKLARKIEPSIWTALINRKSTRPGVKVRTESPTEKFRRNVEVLQRTGGVTPYGKPLADNGYAIDSRWRLNKGKAEQQFRLVIGRSEPMKERKTDLEEVA